MALIPFNQFEDVTHLTIPREINSLDLSPDSLKRHIARHGGAGYLTAHRGEHNTEPGKISRVNLAANDNLEHAIRKRGLTYSKVLGVGQEEGGGHNTEHSFVILKPHHLDHGEFRGHLMDLANHVPGHEQHSFVHDIGGIGHLIHANDPEIPRGTPLTLGRLTGHPHSSPYYTKLLPWHATDFSPENSVSYVSHDMKEWVEIASSLSRKYFH